MCGIVGYLGPRNPKDVIIEGLKRLEYRGYDSAGVAVLDHGHFKLVRAPGKLSELQKKLQGETFSGHLGIGHTRWATHGVPNERNAHPHVVEGVSIVHNGIIENYQEIRERLRVQGVTFKSETDSELVAHLIAHALHSTKDLLKAVELILPELQGAYAIVAVWDGQQDTMVAFKNGPPLVLGVGEKEMIVASDVQALISVTNKVVYLEDREVVKVQGTKFQVYSAAGAPIERKIHTVTWNAETSEKAGFAHFMLKEIHEQPRAVANAIAPHIDLGEMKVRLRGVGFGSTSFDQVEGNLNSAKAHATDADLTAEVLKTIDRVFIIACGTSFYAGMVGKYLIESLARVAVEVEIASEFRYRDPVIPKNSLVIVVSQSGETADTLAALRLAKQAGVKTLSICNVKHSSIDREAHGHLYMGSGPEIGVASTKAFVSTLAMLNVFSIYLGQVRGTLSATDERDLIQALVAAPSQMEAVLSYDSFFAEAANELKAYRGLLYMGRGVSYPIAMEGALKLKELAYMHAEGYAAGEMKHGPLALIDERMLIVMVAPSDRHYEKTLSNLEEARARGGKIISLGSGENDDLKRVSEYYLALPKAHWTINALLEVIPLQLLAYHVAKAMGHDVDQPRNLAKSVTVE
jgi:glucosamine--fructose-6-phosphate aminotransferase (isomerizing)